MDVQVVVLAAGSGALLPTVISDGYLKACVPLVGSPLISFVLRMLGDCCGKVNVTKCVVITKQCEEAQIADCVPKVPFEISIQAVDDAAVEKGTVECLRHVHLDDQPTLVLPCDIVGPLQLDKIVDAFKGAAVVALMNPEPVYKTHASHKTWAVVDANRLLFFRDASEFEIGGNNDLVLPLRTLLASPSATLYSEAQDLHTYLFSAATMRYIRSDALPSDTDFIRGDLLPYLTAYQDSDEMQEWFEGKPVRYCFADPPCVRIASRLDLEETTVRLLNPKPEILAKTVPPCLHPTISPGQKDAVVADGAEIGAKVQLKQSTVAAGCVVGANARLHRTILLPGASVGAGCQLRSCIVGAGAVVGEKCKVGTLLTGKLS
ncbi:MAG: hypothetical protein KVP17_002789 [Porospora cf. gigantea B]|uniref:uncharacterized protein n=1 Tax=Porospora cf. gigantea B TaxID=2853592 RepID=UPI0035718D80|nr:MAG: hypothetical protein KVP17_002789 [Porospora cf. gigantea B]